jgi:hypothetical protein
MGVGGWVRGQDWWYTSTATLEVDIEGSQSEAGPGKSVTPY